MLQIHPKQRRRKQQNIAFLTRAGDIPAALDELQLIQSN